MEIKNIFKNSVHQKFCEILNKDHNAKRRNTVTHNLFKFEV